MVQAKIKLDKNKKLKKFNKKTYIIVGVAMLMVLLVAGVSWYFLSKPKQDQENSTTNEQSQNVGRVLNEYEQAEGLASEGKYVSAVKKMKEQAEKDGLSEEEVLNYKYSLAVNAGKEDEALSVSEKLYEKAPDYTTVSQMAISAAVAGDQAKLNKYYALAVEALKSEYGEESEDYADLLYELKYQIHFSGGKVE